MGSASPEVVVRHGLLGRRWLAPQSPLVPASVWSIVVPFLTAAVALRLRRVTCEGVAGFAAGGWPAFANLIFVARTLLVARGTSQGVV
jgi:hypothetical protein